MTEVIANHPRYRLEFVVLSFEGPDLYSLVGGLGIRVTELTKVMASLGYKTRLFFVGDPSEPDYEVKDGLLHYHRWSTWVSRQYPKGVYEGEAAKVEDYRNSLPEFLVSKVIAKNACEGIFTVVLGEDWHTAGTMVRVDELLKKKGLSSDALLFWNANNVFGFETIDFPTLEKAVQLITISRYMKERMHNMGLETIVVGNGVPRRYWEPVDRDTGRRLQKMLPGILLTKIGRYHPDKRWMMAIESLDRMRSLGLRPKLVVRGGREAHGLAVRKRAEELGFSWGVLRPEGSDTESILTALKELVDHDIVELDFFVPEEFLRSLYWASTAVLANSIHEPFGLVGLEVMACAGLVMTGATGEEYVRSFHNGIEISSDDPWEIATYVKEIKEDFRLVENLRHNGFKTAQLYSWQTVVEDFLRKVDFICHSQGLEIDPEKKD